MPVSALSVESVSQLSEYTPPRPPTRGQMLLLFALCQWCVADGASWREVKPVDIPEEMIGGRR